MHRHSNTHAYTRSISRNAAYRRKPPTNTAHSSATYLTGRGWYVCVRVCMGMRVYGFVTSCYLRVYVCILCAFVTLRSNSHLPSCMHTLMHVPTPPPHIHHQHIHTLTHHHPSPPPPRPYVLVSHYTDTDPKVVSILMVVVMVVTMMIVVAMVVVMLLL